MLGIRCDRYLREIIYSCDFKKGVPDQFDILWLDLDIFFSLNDLLVLRYDALYNNSPAPFSKPVYLDVIFSKPLQRICIIVSRYLPLGLVYSHSTFLPLSLFYLGVNFQYFQLLIDFADSSHFLKVDHHFIYF